MNIIKYLPVSVDNRMYKNIFCAICNNETFANIEFWKIVNSNQPLDAASNELYNKNLLIYCFSLITNNPMHNILFLVNIFRVIDYLNFLKEICYYLDIQYVYSKTIEANGKSRLVKICTTSEMFNPFMSDS